jgi:hypothetical protein
MALPVGPLRHYTPRSENRQAARAWRKLGFALLRLQLLFVEPGYGADLRAPAQCSVETSYVQGLGMAHEHLAGKVEAESAMLQPSLDDAALEDRALTPARRAELIATATAEILLVSVTGAAIAAADSRNPAFQAFTIAHIRTLVSMPHGTRVSTSAAGPVGRETHAHYSRFGRQYQTTGRTSSPAAMVGKIAAQGSPAVNHGARAWDPPGECSEVGPDTPASPGDCPLPVGMV